MGSSAQQQPDVQQSLTQTTPASTVSGTRVPARGNGGAGRHMSETQLANDQPAGLWSRIGEAGRVIIAFAIVYVLILLYDVTITPLLSEGSWWDVASEMLYKKALGYFLVLGVFCAMWVCILIPMQRQHHKGVDFRG